MEETIGNKLQKARQSKGYTLDDLQQMTKIQKKYLIAIEEGDYDIMPGEFYTKAFIKQVADTVGLDGENAVIDYLKQKDAPVVVEPVAPVQPVAPQATKTPEEVPVREVSQPIAKESEHEEENIEPTPVAPSRQDVKPTTQAAVDHSVNQFKRYIPTILIAMLALATVFAMYKAFKDGNETLKPSAESQSSLVESSEAESSQAEESSEAESSQATSESTQESSEPEATSQKPEETDTNNTTTTSSQEVSSEEVTPEPAPTPAPIQNQVVQGNVTNIGYDADTVNYSVQGISYPVEVVISNQGDANLWSKITLDGEEVVDDVFLSGATFNAIANEGTGVINVEFGYRPIGDIYVNGIHVDLPYDSNATDVNFYLN
ncbi:protein RodZ, contains Xre-like HTH and DUF4115 domains [Granulicatella balaenopterae]|uniref:Protein RodZ, contains Xre-like HTH and DUF4115 domains n=1 Tax=Granulicatella balaenopterae TaxID=137733 RepID=A0A1H9K8E2_9LACT|nr:helix-turn-helix transcriptional regulator [Granulicatella balaenopterae]SEQ95197.1 protein RodZ, contains Xre-like HTH and DUF4115 domains [Granulicatella balaenopterae]